MSILYFWGSKIGTLSLHALLSIELEVGHVFVFLACLVLWLALHPDGALRYLADVWKKFLLALKFSDEWPLLQMRYRPLRPVFQAAGYIKKTMQGAENGSCYLT